MWTTNGGELLDSEFATPGFVQMTHLAPLSAITARHFPRKSDVRLDRPSCDVPGRHF